MSSSAKSIPTIEPLIHVIRGQKVILDSDLARLYGVATGRLNEQVKRNKDRFPADFMFRLSVEESHSLISQNAISKVGRGGRRQIPLVFTEQGAVMAANVLNSNEAVRMSVFVVRAFVRMREVFLSRKELAEQLTVLEKKLTDRLDVHEVAIVDVLQRLMDLLEPPPSPPVPPKGPIGFHP